MEQLASGVWGGDSHGAHHRMDSTEVPERRLDTNVPIGRSNVLLAHLSFPLTHQ